MWRERTSTPRSRSLPTATTSIPTATASRSLPSTPPPTARSATFGGNYFYYIPNTGFSGVETITYKLRDSHGMLSTGLVTVYVDSGVASTATSPNVDTDYAVVYQGSSVGFTVADLLLNDSDPQDQTLTVRRRLATIDRRRPHRHTRHRVHLHTQHRRQLRQHRPRHQLSRHRHRRPRLRSQPADPHPRRRRHQPATRGPRRCGAHELNTEVDGHYLRATTSTPTATASASSPSTPPPTARSSTFGGNYFYYTPNTGFSGVETITYTLRDSHGLLSNGLATVWVDSGVASDRDAPERRHRLRRRLPRIDLVHRRRSVAQRHRPPRPDVDRASPSRNHHRRHPHRHTRHRVHLHTRATTRLRQHRPPPRLPRHRHRRPRHRRQHPAIRILAAGDPNQPPVAATMWRARTSTPTVDGHYLTATTSTPTATASRRRRRHPRPRHDRQHSAATTSTTHPTPASPASRPSPTPSATATASLQRLATVWVDSGVARPRRHPNARHRLRSSSTKGSIVGFTVAELLLNDSDPQDQTLTVRRRLGTTAPTASSPAHSPPGSSTHPSNDPASSAPTTTSTIWSPTPTATSPRNILDPHPRRRRPQPATRRGARHGIVQRLDGDGVHDANDFDPDGDAFSVVGSRHPRPRHRRQRRHQRLQLHTRTPGSPASNTITYTIRDSHGLLATGLATISVNTTGTSRRSRSRPATRVQPAGRVTINLSAVDPEGMPLTWSSSRPRRDS